MIKAILLFGTIILISTTLLNRISRKLGLPVLLAFIILGMVFGYFFRIHFDNPELAKSLAELALIFIMFYGGFGTSWEAAKPVSVKAGIMASFGVVLTSVLTGFFCHFALGIHLAEGLLIGAVVSSTDAACTFSILKSGNLSLRYSTDSLLEMESGSNDPCAYMMTMIFISMIKGTTEPLLIAKMLFLQLLVGIVFAFIIAFTAGRFINRFSFGNEGFQSAFVTAVALLSYALPTLFGGNGYLCTYIVGIVLGNSLRINRQSLVGAFDGITSLMQILIFFILGLMAVPTNIISVMPLGLAITVFMWLIARPAVTFALLTPLGTTAKQSALVSWAGLRGAASIVFALIASFALPDLKIDIFSIVFSIVIFSILIQGTTLGTIAKKLDMFDPEGNVFKTFNDYSEEGDLDFISIKVNKDNTWAGKKIRELSLPREVLIVLMQKNGKTVIPNGNTPIETGDTLVISGSRFAKSSDIVLREVPVKRKHKWAGLTVSEAGFPKNHLIIIIKRKGENIVPNGNTVIQANDLLVFNILRNAEKNTNE